MKKLHSLFIFSILALTMFVGCQMPANETTPTNTTPTETTPTETPTEDPVDDTPTVADFVDATDYNVYKDGNFLATIKGKILNAICKNEGFVKDTDYTIEGNKVTVITGSRLYDWLTPQNLGGLVSDDEGGNGNGESGTETPSDTYDVFVRASEGYYLGKNTSSESGKEVVLPIMTSDGNTPGLYLVKVYITDSNNNDIKSTVGLKIEDNKIKFTMPSTNVDVFASFEDVSFDSETDDLIIVVYDDDKGKPVVNDFDVGLYFDTKDFDNLKLIDSKYVFYVANKEGCKYCEDDEGGYYECKITSTAKNYNFCAIVGEKVFTPLHGQININSAN